LNRRWGGTGHRPVSGRIYLAAKTACVNDLVGESGFGEMASRASFAGLPAESRSRSNPGPGISPSLAGRLGFGLRLGGRLPDPQEKSDLE
jgi:hypothetical protein